MNLFRSAFGRSLGAGHYIFATVFLVRVSVLARLTLSPFLLPLRGDMHFYDDWARRILHGDLTDHHAFYGLPLYAYLLALIYKLAGYGPFIPGLLQAGLDAGTSVIIYKLGVRVFGSGDLGRCPKSSDAATGDWPPRRRNSRSRVGLFRPGASLLPLF